MLVVISIIAILAAVIVPNAFKAIEKAKIARIISDCKNIEQIALTHYVDTGEWPRIQQKHPTLMQPAGSMISLIKNESNVPSWDGPYLDAQPMNPLGGGYGFGFLAYPGNESAGYRTPATYVITIVASEDNKALLRRKLDKIIDHDDGISKGKIRWDGVYPGMTKWIIRENITGVRNTHGNLQYPY